MKIYSQKWLKLFNVKGMTLFPFVFIYYDKNNTPVYLIKHEECHLNQINKYGALRFYCAYIKEYLIARLKGYDHYNSYLNISFEREARKAEQV